jgi:hypothetical protein
MSEGEWSTPAGSCDTGLPAAGYDAQSGLTPEQLAYQRGRQDAIRSMYRPRMTVFRVLCGILWGAISAAMAGGAIYNLVHANIGEFFLGLVICVLAGWYDYRIWTLKARRLFFII